MASINGPVRPTQPLTPSATPAPAATPAPELETCPVAELPEASHKGLLDYPKDLLMNASKAAAAGTARNTVEFYDDMHDIRQAGSDFGEHVKQGEALKAVGDVGRMGWNILSGLGNALQAGFSSMAGGITLIPTVALNALDKGGETAGKHLRASDSAIGQTVGKGLRGLTGENSHEGYLQAIRQAGQEAELAARQANQ